MPAGAVRASASVDGAGVDLNYRRDLLERVIDRFRRRASDEGGMTLALLFRLDVLINGVRFADVTRSRLPASIYITYVQFTDIGHPRGPSALTVSDQRNLSRPTLPPSEPLWDAAEAQRHRMHEPGGSCVQRTCASAAG